MRTSLVEIDYEELAKHLNDHYTGEHDPFLLGLVGFDRFREVLVDHVEQAMDEDNKHVADTVLLGILFKYHICGVVTNVTVTHTPGIVVQLPEHSLALPLVLIELNT